MKRPPALALLLLGALSSAAFAHFPFLLPADHDGPARLIFSEDLSPDPDVDISVAKDAKLFARNRVGVRPLDTKPGEKRLELIGLQRGDDAIYGTVDLGVIQRGDGPAHHLVYYPQTILLGFLSVGDVVPLRIETVRSGGTLRLRVVADKKPLAAAKIVVIRPDGVSEDFVTDADGNTPVLEQRGRYAAWTRQWLDTPGTAGGKEFTQLRQYATLVVDVSAEPATTRAAADEPAGPSVQPAGKLPEATSSFGAVESLGWLYVYGGHVAPTHEYHTAAVSGKFARRPIGGGPWEPLPDGIAVQGMNLAADDTGTIYRVGGMAPRNAKGEKVDLRSIATGAKFDPTTKRWTDLPTMPAPRSSHDLAIIGNKLYVVGGWTLTGPMTDGEWPDEMWRLDLGKPGATWEALPQPFHRRALVVAVHDEKLYVIGGFDDNDDASRRVDVFDPATGEWTQAPGLPGPPINGFSPAALDHVGTLYASVGDGTLYQLNEDELVWDEVAKATPRIVHRLISDGPDLLILGGAATGKNLDLIEKVTVEPGPASAGPAR